MSVKHVCDVLIPMSNNMYYEYIVDNEWVNVTITDDELLELVVSAYKKYT